MILSFKARRKVFENNKMAVPPAGGKFILEAVLSTLSEHLVTRQFRLSDTPHRVAPRSRENLPAEIEQELVLVLEERHISPTISIEVLKRHH